MITGEKESGYLTGQLLIAMPSMPDPRFERTVIYICAHSAEGAMGLVVNRLFDELTFIDLLDQVGVDTEDCSQTVPVHSGGPVESGRGFVLHSAEFTQEGTMAIDERFSLTASVDILRSIAQGGGPKQSLLALGYSGWGPGQLESEIQANGWLTAPADAAIVFNERSGREMAAGNRQDRRRFQHAFGRRRPRLSLPLTEARR